MMCQIRYCTFPSSMLHYANFTGRDQSLNHSKLALISRLLANEIEESSMDVLGQVSSLQ
jgi:hypothetical protein